MISSTVQVVEYHRQSTSRRSRCICLTPCIVNLRTGLPLSDPNQGANMKCFRYYAARRLDGLMFTIIWILY